MSDVVVVDLRAPLDHIVYPVQVAEALERTASSSSARWLRM
jgi:hypothetical protein